MRVIPQTTLAPAAEALLNGELVIAPTRRWYMICAAAANETACRNIFNGKRRSPAKPLVFIAPSGADHASHFVLTDDALKLADAFWPGDLALMLPWRHPEDAARYPFVGSPALTTRDPGLLGELAATAGIAVAATTANISGDAGPDDRGPAVTLAEVDEFLTESGITVSITVDGGICPAGNHMTIVDCSDAQARLVRSGLVHHRAIAAALGRKP
jgi:L-threonylcarbamoyladenylate synthase